MAAPVPLTRRPSSRRQPVAPTPAEYRRRRITGRALEVLAIFVGAALGVLGLTAARSEVSVLVVARPVAAGAHLEAADVRTAGIRAVRGIEYVRARDQADVVGKVARVSLAPGSLLVRSELGAAIEDADRIDFPLSVKPGQFPPGLREGDDVLIVVTPASGARAETSGRDQGVTTIEAVVRVIDRSRATFGDSQTVITLSVPKDELQRLAVAGADGQFTIAGTP